MIFIKKSNKKTIITIFITTFVTLFIREIQCAIIYLYNIALSRSNKFILSKLIDVKNDTEIFVDEINKQKEAINKWINETFNYVLKIKSFDNINLFAEVFLNNSSKKWVIILHGYGLSSEFMYYAGLEFYKEDYNILIPDLRGHGMSEGNYIGMGWHDRIDIIYWINEIIKKDKQAKIVLYGVSMGASTALMVSGEKLPHNVKCIISDCAYTSAYDIFKYQIKKFHKIPAFPILDLMGLICKKKNNYSIRKASALKQVQKSNIPTLFIHGLKDNFVPISMMYALFNNASCPKDKLIVKNAGHTTCEMKAKKLYWRKIFKFLKDI